MGARSGNNYLSSLRKLKAEVWLGATRVTDPTIHPAFVQRARALASLYDLQMEHPAAMTWRLDDGDRVALSFIQPQSAAEVQARGVMFRRWAEYHGGRLRETPDAVNAGLAALAAAAARFAASESRFGANLENYYRRARHHDWCIAHTLASPGSNVAGEAAGLGNDGLYLVTVSRVDEGLVVSGARRVSTLAPLAEELLVLPEGDAASKSVALVFAINCNAPGFRLLCGDALEASQPGSAPTATGALNERVCVARFERVLVPWERVFLSGNVDGYDTLIDETGAALNMRHQGVVRAVVAAEFRLGLAANLAARGARAFPRVRERLADMALAIHLARTLLQAAEASARPNRWGQWIPPADLLDLAARLIRERDP